MNGDSYSRDGGRAGGSRPYASRDEHRDRGDRERSERDRDERGGGDRDRRRRRSRSPRQNSRRDRDRDYEVDTYSSSRDYRERERESNYARRDHRRDDRNWGDSYSRRDRPRHDRDRDRERDRDDMRGPPRRGGDRDRDYDDRGRGSRRDGGFGGGGARDRKKSASPPVKKREPTPDLDGYVNIQVRPRRMTQWDIKPAGYDNITAEQAKLSGMFPLPGAPRAAPMDPTKLAAFVNPATGTANAAGLQPLNAKQAKRLFVYNLPSNVTSNELVDFFNLQLNGLNVVSGNNPCLSATVATNNQYASVEFKAPEDATVALAMDGIAMQSQDSLPDADAEGLSIRRPKDYITPSTDENPPPVDRLSSVVNDSPYKLSISNIPIYVEEDQVRELVETFGELRSFVLVKDNSSGQHRGIAFCEYVDRSTLDDVIAGLNSIPLGDSHLKVTRATVGVAQQIGVDGGVNAISILASTGAAEGEERSRVVCLLNMVTPDELLNDQEYEDIKEEVHEECQKFGHILDIKIPRPAGVRTTAGVGKIYIKYDTPESAQKAIQNLAGRQFARRTVVATEFSEESFDVEAW